MRLYLLAAALLLMSLMVTGVSTQAQAPTLTPSPTLEPLQPTRTSVYLYLRPTPTMLAVGAPLTSLDLSADASNLADTAINLYRYANRDHVIDYITTIASVGVALALLARSIRRSQKKDTG